MTQTHPASPEFLPLDVEERRLGIECGLVALGIRNAEPLRLLDVGGAPGRLARALASGHPERRVLVVDLPPGPTADYLRASGLALPFTDQSFDVVYCSDTLEHIPAADRPRFLSELARVARRGVIVAAPFTHPAVDRAEELLTELHRDFLNAPHPWLAEHRAHGLPDRTQTCELLARACAVSPDSVRLIPNAPLERWYVFQGLELLTRAVAALQRPWATFRDFIPTLWPAAGASSSTSIPYRWVLAASRSADSVVPRPDPVLAGADELELLKTRMEALATLARGWVGQWRSTAFSGDAEAEVLAQREVINRLLSVVEKQNPDEAPASPATPSSPPRRQGLRQRASTLLNAIRKAKKAGR
jgi:SAM-dependent methyltransferase